jgi:hypothetical protein
VGCATGTITTSIGVAVPPRSACREFSRDLAPASPAVPAALAALAARESPSEARASPPVVLEAESPAAPDGLEDSDRRVAASAVGALVPLTDDSVVGGETLGVLVEFCGAATAAAASRHPVVVLSISRRYRM